MDRPLKRGRRLVEILPQAVDAHAGPRVARRSISTHEPDVALANLPREVDGDSVLTVKTRHFGRIPGLSVILNTNVTGVTAPVWLRLMVERTSVVALYKKNATDAWTMLGVQQFSAASNPFAYAGLAVTSHQDGTLATATFSHVDVAAQDPVSYTLALIGTSTGSASADMTGAGMVSARGTSGTPPISSHSSHISTSRGPATAS
jgi:hypothetical protein